jgi:hypothetical protein
MSLWETNTRAESAGFHAAAIERHARNEMMTSVRHDRVTKRRFFQAHGVPDYWVVDGDAETFEVWRPGEDRAAPLDRSITWQPEGAPEPVVIDLREFFAEIRDDPSDYQPIP